MVLFEMLTGVSPFRRDTTWATLDATMRQRAPALSAINPGVPPRLAAIVARCLAKDPNGRPPKPQLVFKEILDWLDRTLGPVSR